jgi:hypothetical protein
LPRPARDFDRVLDDLAKRQRFLFLLGVVASFASSVSTILPLLPVGLAGGTTP